MSIDLNDFLRLLEVREVLEALAARLAAERGSDAQRNDLRQIQREFESLKSTDAHRWVFPEIDMRFHAAIRAMAHNKDLDAALARSQGRAHLSLNTLWRGEKDIQVTQLEHAAICDAIVDGATDRAEMAARAHIVSVRQRILAVLEQHERADA